MRIEPIWAWAILWLYSSFGLLYGINWWLSRHIQGLGLLIFNQPATAFRLYQYLLAPGVILHELSHWLMAKILLVPTGKLMLFQNEGLSKATTRAGKNAKTTSKNAPPSRITLGYVEIYKTDPLRQSLIGVAPLISGIIFLLLLAGWLNIQVVEADRQNFNQQVLAVLTGLPQRLYQSLLEPLNLLAFYLVFTISNAMLPSQSDRRAWLWGFVLPSILLILLALSGLLPPLPPEGQSTLLTVLTSLTITFSFAALINVLLAAVIATLEMLLARMRGKRVVY